MLSNLISDLEILYPNVEHREPIAQLIEDSYHKNDSSILELLSTINQDFYLARDKTQNFEMISPKIDALANFTDNMLTLINEKGAWNKEIAEQAIQLCFKVSQFYSIGSASVTDSASKCLSWLNMAKVLVKSNALSNTKIDAIWHNLMAGHQYRLFDRGYDYVNLEMALDNFTKAVSIYENMELDPKLPLNAHYRHVILCLAHSITSKIIYNIANNGQLPSEHELDVYKVNSLLDKIPMDTLVLPGAPNKADNYRIANTLIVKAKLHLIAGRFSKAQSFANNAVLEMKKSLPDTQATGQVALLNKELANINLAAATANLLDSYQMAESNIESEYAYICKNLLLSLNDVEYSKLARMVYKPANNLIAEEENKSIVDSTPKVRV